jgi:hypothetical protein
MMEGGHQYGGDIYLPVLGAETCASLIFFA